MCNTMPPSPLDAIVLPAPPVAIMSSAPPVAIAVTIPSHRVKGKGLIENT
jgi:hypothetical protein